MGGPPPDTGPSALCPQTRFLALFSFAFHPSRPLHLPFFSVLFPLPVLGQPVPPVVISYLHGPREMKVKRCPLGDSTQANCKSAAWSLRAPHLTCQRHCPRPLSQHRELGSTGAALCFHKKWKAKPLKLSICPAVKSDWPGCSLKAGPASGLGGLPTGSRARRLRGVSRPSTVAAVGY